MRITRIVAIPIRVPMKRHFEIRGGRFGSLDHVVVRIETADGEVGYGEAVPLPVYSEGDQLSAYRAIEERLKGSVIGEDPYYMERIVERIDLAIEGHGYAKMAIEIALWDLLGRSLGLPCYMLLGGLYRRALPVAWSIGYGNAEEMVEEAKRAVKEGYKAVKLKVGRGPLDIEVVKRAREELGWGVKIRVDANQGYTLDRAIAVLKEIERYDLQLIEQPLERYDLEGMARLGSILSIPLLADESAFSVEDIIEIARMNAADAINVKIGKPGGILGSKRMAMVAEAFGMPCLLGSNFELSIATAAALHFAASTRNIRYECELIGPALADGDVVKERLVARDGWLEVPSGAGLGVDVDDGMIEEYRVSYV